MFFDLFLRWVRYFIWIVELVMSVYKEILLLGVFVFFRLVYFFFRFFVFYVFFLFRGGIG